MSRLYRENEPGTKTYTFTVDAESAEWLDRTLEFAAKYAEETQALSEECYEDKVQEPTMADLICSLASATIGDMWKTLEGAESYFTAWETCHLVDESPAPDVQIRCRVPSP